MTTDTIHSEACFCKGGTFDIDCTEASHGWPSARDTYSGVIRCKGCSQAYVMEGSGRMYRVHLRGEVERAEAFRNAYFERGKQIPAMPEVQALKEELASKMDAIPHKTKKHELVRPLTYDSQATFSKKYAGAKHFIDGALYTVDKLDKLMSILRKHPAALVQRLAEHQADDRNAPAVATLRTVSKGN
jgi:hypothetical protein